MGWKIEFDENAERELKKLDPQIAKRILTFLFNRVAPLENPRSIGKALKGSKLGSFWRYRVGDFRIVTCIEDDAVRVLVVRVGNRRQIYRK